MYPILAGLQFNWLIQHATVFIRRMDQVFLDFEFQEIWKGRPMPAPVNCDELIELIRKSGVADEKRLDVQLQELGKQRAFPKEPKQLAAVLIRESVLTRFQAEQLLLGKWRRFSIGKYKVLERLGSGGMGSVYLCEHKLMRRRVAVKVLPTAKANDEASLQRFYREARAVAALDHPNIVHAYDIDQDENLHFLVMEYVDGASLQEIVRKSGALEPVRASHYIRQTCLGLAHAHAAGLVHRDIKPANLLVDRTGTLKILDMGLARFFNDTEDILTKKYDENVLGTADYLAPEQAVDSHEADTRADIYSLGATFYFMLTGRTPFEEGTVAQKLLWHQTRQPKPIRDFAPNVPQQLQAIVEKMMAKAPEDRYQHPIEVSDALAEWTDSPIAPPTDNEMPKLSPAAIGPQLGEATQTGFSNPSTATKKSWQISGSSSAVSSPTTMAKEQTATAKTEVKGPSLLPPKLNAPSSYHPPTLPSLGDNNDPGSPDKALGYDDLAFAPEGPAAHYSNSSEDKSGYYWLAIGTVGLTIAIGLAVLVWSLLGSGIDNGNTGLKTRTLIVSREAGKQSVYSTIESALKQAKAGDIIEIWDERIEENLWIDPGKNIATGVTLQAGPKISVLWTQKKNSTQPLVRLYNAAGFRLKGDRITLNGQGETPFVMMLSGESPGLTLEDCTIRGFSQAGVLITSCQGSAKKNVTLSGLRFDNHTVEANQHPILFKSSVGFSNPICDFISIANCEFGPFAADARVVRENAKVTGPNVLLPAGIQW